MARKLPKTPQAAKNLAESLRKRATKMDKRASNLEKKEVGCVPAKKVRAAENKVNRLEKQLTTAKAQHNKVAGKKTCTPKTKSSGFSGS